MIPDFPSSLNDLNISLDLSHGSKVPNQFPTTLAPYRLAIIGEAPGADEDSCGIPFSGKSGQFLDAVLGASGLSRQACFVGNVCQVRPPANNIGYFKWDGEEIQSGLEQLTKDLQEFRPNLCLLTGNTPLLAAMGNESRKVSDWRGSLFIGNVVNSPFYNLKCLASYHPAYVLRDYTAAPLFRFDLARAREESLLPELILPVRNLHIHLSADEVIDRLNGILPGQLLSLDIEGGIQQGMSCVSFATSDLESFLVPFGRYSDWDEARVLQVIARVLADHSIPKVLQNSLYDRMVLAYRYGVIINNVREDTMLKGWEIYSELPKALGVQASIWTKEPYYKADRKSDDQDTHHRYCCKDSCVTLEICEAQESAMKPEGLAHYHHNMGLLSPLLYMQLRGWNFNKVLADQKTAEVKLAMSESQSRVTTHCGYAMNPRSTQQCAKLLYDIKGLPTQFKIERGKKTTKVTTDTGSLLELGKKHKDPILHEIIMYRRLGKLLDVTEAVIDPDGRLRCNYNLVGTETGRLSCSGSTTGSGFNLQTVTEKLRILFAADPGCDLGQFDLAGADGWTVAPHCARLGDSAMIEDYFFGLKPAKLIALMYEKGAGVNKLSRNELKEMSNEVDSKGWLYFACKRVQHGSNYLLGKHRMSQQILEDSFKKLGTPIYVEPNVCERLQQLYLTRYWGVPLWQQWVGRQVQDKGYLVSASGHVRKLFGRRKRGSLVDHETWRAACSNEPQENTTYATNRALEQLWNDPENRIRGPIEQAIQWISGGRRGSMDCASGFEGSTSLLVQPVHHVHDALIPQWPSVLRDWVIPKVKSWFNNPMEIAGMTITIPFEGAWGENWGELKNPVV